MEYSINELSKLAEFTDEPLTKSYSEYQKAFKIIHTLSK